MSFRTADYDFTLPDELIARHPLPRREDSRMLVLTRATETIEHRQFADFPSYLREGDLVVLNDTRVIPARVFSDDGRIEFLFLENLREHTWKCLVKPGRKMRLGAKVAVRGIAGVVITMGSAQRAEPERRRRVPFDHGRKRRPVAPPKLLNQRLIDGGQQGGVREGGGMIAESNKAAGWYGALRTERNRVAIACASVRPVDRFLIGL